MFYLFNKNGITATFCADYDRLFDMFATVEKEVTETGEDGAEVTKTVKCLPDGYSIKEYDGYIEPGMLYLDNEGNVRERVFEVDEAEETARKKAAALKELDTQYASDKQELSSQYLDAAMSGDTDTMDAIKDELKALNEKYDSDYAELSK